MAYEALNPALQNATAANAGLQNVEKYGSLADRSAYYNQQQQVNSQGVNVLNPHVSQISGGQQPGLNTNNPLYTTRTPNTSNSYLKNPGLSQFSTDAANTIGSDLNRAVSQAGGNFNVQNPATPAGQQYDRAVAQAQAGPVTPNQTFGSGQFSVTPQAPQQVVTPPTIGGVLDYNSVSPYITAQTNVANAQTYANLGQGLTQLGQGYNTAQQGLSTLGASEQQTLQQNYQNQVGQNAAQMAASGLTGSTTQSAMNAQAQRTRDLAQTALIEQTGIAQGQVAIQGASAMASYLASPQYNNDNSTLLSAMSAMASFYLADSGAVGTGLSGQILASAASGLGGAAASAGASALGGLFSAKPAIPQSGLSAAGIGTAAGLGAAQGGVVGGPVGAGIGALFGAGGAYLSETQ